MGLDLKFPLCDLLISAQTGAYTQGQLIELHRLCYLIARRLVRRKILSGKLCIDMLGMTESDVTHDCIAELFIRNADNELIEFSKYFEYQRLSIDETPEELLFVHLRRLVFSFVNDNLFRIYNEADPALGKIIRNIKSALNNSSCFKIVIRFDEQYVVPTAGSLLPHNPTISNDELQREISDIMMTEDDIPSIIQKLTSVVGSWETYQRSIRLISLAQAIRSGYQQLGFATTNGLITQETSFDDGNVEKIISEVCRNLSHEMKPRYVDVDKVDGRTFDQYVQALERVLTCEFLDGKDDASYFDCLREIDPALTKSDYVMNHRAIFEYLAKLAKQRARVSLKEIL